MLNDSKSWLEVEMEETVALLRKKLECLNDVEADGLDSDDINSIEKIYKTLYYIHCISKK